MDLGQTETGDHQHDERLFRLLVERVKDYAIFMLDPRGRVLTWNSGAEALKGYRADEIIGQVFERFYSEDDRRQNKPKRLLDIALAEGRVEDEGWRVHKDGSRFWADVVITALHDEANKLQGFAKVTRDLTERRRAEEALRAAQHELEQRVIKRTQELEEANRALREKNQELETSKQQLQERNDELEKLHDVVVGRELKMMTLELEVSKLKDEIKRLTTM
jgi:PAS domain S-box-containing protein